MDTDKFKGWLLKINNVRLQKPSQISKIKNISQQIEQTKLSVQKLLERTQQIMRKSQEDVNTKTTQLEEIKSRNKQKLQIAYKNIQRQSQKSNAQMIAQFKKIQQNRQDIIKKSNALDLQLRQRNENYLEMLRRQLESIQIMRQKAQEQKVQNFINYQNWFTSSLKKADEILVSQSKDLALIDQFQRELLARCDQIEKQYERKVEQQIESSEQKQKLVFRKIQSLISDIDID